ncbi:phytoene desaturase family protein [Sorangium cellulosum]|uniref:FAD-dependent oxidoreductase n=1 Tax=Sorangium cellulosum TaxID=56 RepID=A0A150QSZ9_SORCE|nr:FAD-dependent oxidoreductase [Sorangium cellulosum]
MSATRGTGALDAVVIGAGPNGLAAAVALAGAGLQVRVIEARDTVGGGARTAELTGPGFRHDVCSAIHPTAVISPFLRTLPLEEHGVAWIYPEAALAHPLADGRAGVLYPDLDRMAETLGEEDAAAWSDLFSPLLAGEGALFEELLGPLRIPPRHPLLLARFGLSAIRSADGLARDTFRGDAARGLFGGCAAHSFLPLETLFSASFGIVLALAAHAVGWPVVRTGSQALMDALAAILRARGGEIEAGRTVASLDELPEARAYLFDTTPAAMSRIAGDRLPAGYRRRLERFRHGPGVFKVDYALDGPIPWEAPAAARAATVHVGGTLDELVASERALAGDAPAERPFCLVAQQSLFDNTRAPAGKHTAWVYCHVPPGCEVDMTARIEAQIERFAPGFRDLVRARAVRAPADWQRYNENYVGGDIAGGANDWLQIFARPVASLSPYSTPNPSLYLCSSSTPPGGGVHGMCGYHAAAAALERVFQRPAPALSMPAPRPQLPPRG